jgi:hypothetical protein
MMESEIERASTDRIVCANRELLRNSIYVPGSILPAYYDQCPRTEHTASKPLPASA